MFYLISLIPQPLLLLGILLINNILYFRVLKMYLLFDLVKIQHLVRSHRIKIHVVTIHLYF